MSHSATTMLKMDRHRKKANAPFVIAVPYAAGRNTVNVEFSLTAFQRAPHSDADVEASIDETWERRKRDNPTLFNGRKFRLAGMTVSPRNVLLQIGLTDYKTYIGTHAWDANTPTKTAFFAPRNKARALGNVIILRTTDGAVPFIVRSGQSADAPLALALPGGHPEPDDISSPPLYEKDPRVSMLLPASARAEVLEELFLSDKDVVPASQFIFLGIVDRLPDLKPSLIYYALAHISSDDVRKRYTKGNVLFDESVNLVLDRIECLHRVVVGETTIKGAGRFKPVPETLGAAALWRQMMKTNSNIGN